MNASEPQLRASDLSTLKTEARATRDFAVLLVEDDELQQGYFKRAFEASGLKGPLIVGGDGADALELLRSGKVPPRRVVLLDVHMPRLDGIEFLREVRADPLLKSLVVVMLTTSNDLHDQREALSLNVAGYLLKSTVFANLVEQLRVIESYWSMMEIP